MKFITAQELDESLKDFGKYLEENKILSSVGALSVTAIGKKYAEFYFEQCFLQEDKGIKSIVPKQSLNYREIHLLNWHSSFEELVDGECYFKGEYIGKRGDTK